MITPEKEGGESAERGGSRLRGTFPESIKRILQGAPAESAVSVSAIDHPGHIGYIVDLARSRSRDRPDGAGT
jgi:hypothetical protein